MLNLQLSTIRPYTRADAASLALHANNQRVWRNLRNRMPHPYSKADAVQFIDHCLAAPKQTCFAIQVDGAAVGAIGLELGADVECVAAELGYWLGEAYWGRGIVSEAVAAFTRWAITEYELKRVQAIVFEWNPASARVLEKAGFVREGTLRRSALKDGKIIDRWLYAYVPELATDRAADAVWNKAGTCPPAVTPVSPESSA